MTEPTHGDIIRRALTLWRGLPASETERANALEHVDALEAERDELAKRLTVDCYVSPRTKDAVNATLATYEQMRQRADSEANRADDLANQLLEAENLLAKVRPYLATFGREINAFLTRRL